MLRTQRPNSYVVSSRVSVSMWNSGGVEILGLLRKAFEADILDSLIDG